MALDVLPQLWRHHLAGSDIGENVHSCWREKTLKKRNP